MKRSLVVGPICITTTIQGSGAPLIDKCLTCAIDGTLYKGVAILLSPWKRNSYGESLEQVALVLSVNTSFRRKKNRDTPVNYRTTPTKTPPSATPGGEICPACGENTGDGLGPCESCGSGVC